MREEGVTAERVVTGRFRVSPLTARLVGRTVTERMTPNQARLCLRYVAAVCLRRGNVSLEDFTARALADSATLALARRFAIIEDDNADPNALLPQRAEIDLAEGRTVVCAINQVLGSPELPVSPEAAREKFDACWSSALGPGGEQRTALWETVCALDSLDDVSKLPALTAALE
jgi:2-methylcitrate dehydratase PrpD